MYTYAIAYKYNYIIYPMHTRTHTHTHTNAHTHTAPLLVDDSPSKISDSYIVAFKDELTAEQG